MFPISQDNVGQVDIGFYLLLHKNWLSLGFNYILVLQSEQTKKFSLKKLYFK